MQYLASPWLILKDAIRKDVYDSRVLVLLCRTGLVISNQLWQKRGSLDALLITNS